MAGKERHIGIEVCKLCVRAHGAASRSRLAALSFTRRARIGTVRQRERNTALRASSTIACARAPSATHPEAPR
ncbi:unnamed protein product [Arctia plantaginis]|uniref:Uncharacterized protein n=1 Tax=Arctia plantaginis TaxID=874455 RepID=A0A8S1B4T8_ARCPL|nr:unnamed protein product [Arctia plantaginis]